MVVASISASGAADSDRAAIPEYALKYAPYLHLWSEEEFWPSDIATHLQHVAPAVNHVPVSSIVRLQTLSTYGGDVYLTSNGNVEDQPDWLHSAYGRPDRCGYSSAPATIIVVEKNDGIVDVFYLLFYSYNHGTTSVHGLDICHSSADWMHRFANIRFGSHVGDWEHIMVVTRLNLSFDISLTKSRFASWTKSRLISISQLTQAARLTHTMLLQQQMVGLPPT